MNSKMNSKPQYIKDIEEIGKMNYSSSICYDKQDELFRPYNWNEKLQVFMDVDETLFNEWNNNEGGYDYHFNKVSNMFVSKKRGKKIKKVLHNDYYD
tara:strand:- start:18704 stop:18994 length:291 start_codon:yes stop_codon:yes gene_type:complete